MRRIVIVLLALALPFSLAGPAFAQGTLRIGMTASDIPYTGGPDRQRLRRLPVRRLPDLRVVDRVGPHPRRPARSAGAGARRVVGGAQGRADEVGVQAPEGRDVPRWQPVQRRRGGLHVRVDQEEGRAALRHLRVGPGRLPARLGHRGQQDRRPHGGVRDQQADQLRAVPDLSTCSSCPRPSGRRSRTGASSPSSPRAPAPSR